MAIPFDPNDPDGWLAKFRAGRPDLFPDPNTTGVAQPLGAGMVLRPLGSGPGYSSAWGLPPGFLGSGTVPGSPDSPFALAPAPKMPDFGPDLNAYSSDLHSAAANRVTPINMDVVQNSAKTAGMNAALGALPHFDPNAPAFHWQPVTPQPLGTPQQAPLPTRPAPGHDPMAQILAAAASIFNPQGAGMYSAAPLQAATNVANMQYEDRLRAFQEAQQQMNAQYEAGAANAQQNNRFGLLNADQTQAANIRALGAQNEAALRTVPYALGGAEATTLASGLQPLADQQRTSDVAAADAAALQFKLSTLEKQTAEATALWRATNSPLAREAVMQMRVQSEIIRAQMKNAIDKENADTKRMRVDIYGRRIDDQGRLIE